MSLHPGNFPLANSFSNLNQIQSSPIFVIMTVRLSYKLFFSWIHFLFVLCSNLYVIERNSIVTFLFFKLFILFTIY